MKKKVESKELYRCNRNLICEKPCKPHSVNHVKTKNCCITCGRIPSAKCERVMVVKGNPLGKAAQTFIAKKTLTNICGKKKRRPNRSKYI